MKKIFTLEEANTVLKEIRPVIEMILEIRREILDRQPEVWPTVEKATGNGGSRAASEVAQEYTRLLALVRQVQAAGVLIKDINTGLLDFPSLREGREVYLCWRYGEEEIQYWHDMDAGFAGRQSL